jgi:hypothetical protein
MCGRKTMSWKNIGDISPKNGALLYRDPEITPSGDFTAEAIETISETVMGGDECRILMRRGTVFLSAANLSSAFESAGARLDGTDLVRPGPDGDVLRMPLSSQEGMGELFRAAHGFGGIDVLDIEAFVQIGEDSPYDLPRKLDLELTIYPGDANLWSVLAREMEVCDLTEAEGAPQAEPVDIDEILSL